MEASFLQLLRRSNSSSSDLSSNQGTSSTTKKNKSQKPQASHQQSSEGKICELAVDILADSLLKKSDRFSQTARTAYRNSFHGSFDGETAGAKEVGVKAEEEKEEKKSCHGAIIYEPQLLLHWEGYLYKRTDWLKHWELYFFVLHGKTLFCYDSKESAHLNPGNSKIKGGKFSFSTSVIIKRIHKIYHKLPSSSNSNPPSPVLSVSSSSTGQAPSILPTSSKDRESNLDLRFDLETTNGKILCFEAQSEAEKQTWLHFVEDGIRDAQNNGELDITLQNETISLDIFYKSYEHLVLFFAINVNRNKMIRSFSSFFSLLSGNIVLKSNYLPMVPFAGSYHGKVGVLTYLTKISAAAQLLHFHVDGVQIEQVSDKKKIVVVSGVETYEVHASGRRFTQQWVHKLHFKQQGRISRWEIYGDIVASSVVFKPQGFAADLTLPSLSENIRETMVNGLCLLFTVRKIFDINLNTICSAFKHQQPNNDSNSMYFVRCHMENDLDEIGETRRLPWLKNSSSSNSFNSLVFDEKIELEIDGLSRDDNTILSVEFCIEREINPNPLTRTINPEVPTPASVTNEKKLVVDVVGSYQLNIAPYLNRLLSTSGSTKLENIEEEKISLCSPVTQIFVGHLACCLNVEKLSNNWNKRNSDSGKRHPGPLARINSFLANDVLPGLSSKQRIYSITNNATIVGEPNEQQHLVTRRRNTSNSSILNCSNRTKKYIIADCCFVLDDIYQVVKVVGRGTYGIVIAASDSVNGGTFAIKKIPNFLRHPKLTAITVREIMLMKHLSKKVTIVENGREKIRRGHPCVMNIVSIQKPLSFDTFEDLYIVQPLLETDLCRVIHSRSHVVYCDDHIQWFIYQILCGLNFIHSANILHRDIKPSNILVNSDCSIKICDFGLARHINHAYLSGDSGMNEVLSEYVVTRWYRAPELLLANCYEKSVDIWSCGCIMAELLGREVLFPGKSYVNQLEVIVEVIGSPESFSFCDNPSARRFAGRRFLTDPKLQQRERKKKESMSSSSWSQIRFPNANPEALELLEKLLKFDPRERITAKQALQHPYFDSCRNVPDMEFDLKEFPIEEQTNFDFKKCTAVQLKSILFSQVVAMD